MATKLKAIVTAGLLGTMLAGCSALSGLNPFAENETILPGERKPVLARATDQVSGGTASIGGASALSDWSQAGGNAANNPGHVALSGSGGTEAWHARVIPGAGKRVARSAVPPLVHGGTIFVYDAGGSVAAYSPGGGQRWAVSLAPEGEKSRSPGGGIAASGNMIFAATGYGELVALDASTGARAWTYKLSAQPNAAPTAAGGKVYVVSSTNVLHAVNQSDGTEAWQYPGIPETAGVLSSAGPAVSGDTVVVPYSSGEVIAFNAATGDLKWADAVIRSTRTQAISGLTDVAAAPVIVDGVVYASGVSGRTIAVRLSNGERIWEQNIGSASTPVVSGNAVFLTDLEDNMVALDRAKGTAIWRTALPVVRKKRFFSVWSGPTLAGGARWAASHDGKLVGVDPGTGRILGERALSGPTYIKPIAAGGQLLVLSGDGTLSAFQ
jgi:outer membrane protein assembly factor BamB